MDVEQTIIPGTEDPLAEIRKLGELGEDLLRNIEHHEKMLDSAKGKLKNLTEVLLPQLMLASDLKSLKLRDGTVVEVKPFYHGSISEANKAEAFAWLRDSGYGPIIKETVSATASDRATGVVLMAALAALGVEPEIKQGVHPKTLEAAIRELSEKEIQIPPCISTHIGEKAAFVKPKQAKI
jgi:hypothetical protein